MQKPRRRVIALAAILIYGAAAAQTSEVVSRGEYILRISGCGHCHTVEDGDALGGGLPLETPFGTFYTPNITAHETEGIGAWSEQDFERAVRHGLAPDGSSYFPSFPYTSYTRMRVDDVRALRTYLLSLPPSAQPNREHDLPWYLNWRLAATVWQWLFFEPGEFREHPDQPAGWNRGAYIAEALGHCGECHTPRNLMGALNMDRAYAGNPDGPDDQKVSNITPHPRAGIGKWSRDELVNFLQFGERPDGEYTAGSMDLVVQGLNQSTTEDREALADFLRALPPIGEGPAGEQ